MRVYATPAELAQWITGNPEATAEQAPSNALSHLRSASLVVARVTSRDVYRTDPDGYPTDTALREAFREATCSLASTYSSLGLEVQNGAAGLSPAIVERALGSARIRFAESDSREDARTALASGTAITHEAWQILRGAGLASAAVHSDLAPVTIARGPWPVS